MHFFDVCRGSYLVVKTVEQRFDADIVDVAIFKRFGYGIGMARQRHKHHIRRVLFDLFVISLFGRSFDYYLFFDSAFPDDAGNSLYVRPEFVYVYIRFVFQEE